MISGIARNGPLAGKRIEWGCTTVGVDVVGSLVAAHLWGKIKLAGTYRWTPTGSEDAASGFDWVWTPSSPQNETEAKHERRNLVEKQMREASAYLDTVARLEPEIAPIDTSGAAASIAISLKRIADSLEILAVGNNDIRALGEILSSIESRYIHGR